MKFLARFAVAVLWIFPALGAAQEKAATPAPAPAAAPASVSTAAGASAPVSARAAAPGANHGLTLPAGSTLRVRLGTTLTSKTNQSGDRFVGMVKQAIMDGGQTIVPEGSQVSGHVAFVKPSGRVKGLAQMRIVLDEITTEDDVQYKLAASLEDQQGSPCAKAGSDEEGTIKGCGKSKKEALKDSAMGAAIGAGAGATVGMGSSIDCHYYGNCGGPGFGTSILGGAGFGAGTVLLYNLFKHEKQVILLEGTELTFVVNRTVESSKDASPSSNP